MDKFLFIAFPAITFALLAAGIVLFEIGNYFGNILF